MTQAEKVYQYMTEHGGITSMQAFEDLGITRLSARIFDLRASGKMIKGERSSKKNRNGENVSYMKYTLQKAV